MVVYANIGVAASIFYFAAATTAFINTDNTPSKGFPRPLRPQFQSWYPKYDQDLIRVTHNTCNASYLNYLEAYNSPSGSQNASYLLNRCYHLEGCILHSVPSQVQANFNSAVVILGLTPTLLASIGPSVAEISLPSAHRPLLSFLISMGAPAIWPTRIFEYIHPAEMLRERRGAFGMGKMRPWLAAMLSLGQYVVAVGAMANVITTSVDLGSKSILSWACTTTFAPLLWTIFPTPIHLVSAASYLIARRRSRVAMSSGEEEISATQGGVEQTKSVKMGATAIRSLQRPSYQSWFSWLRDAWLGETTICANRSKSRREKNLDNTALPGPAIILAVVAGGMSFVHIALGIIVFSSLQLIAVRDVLDHIIWRYVVSSAACRLLLIIEISGLRASGEPSSIDAADH